jgi:hypothetical protein
MNQIFVNIKKYVDFFHDGSIFNILHLNGNVIISMQSAEINEGEISEKIPLSDLHRIKGNLHIDDVEYIILNDEKIDFSLIKKNEYGSILDLDISRNEVDLLIRWIDFVNKSKDEDISEIKIKAKNIWWENIPNLYDQQN